MPRKHRSQKAPRAASSHSQYDASYKRLFSEPLMVRSLLQDLIAEDFVAELDLDTLERLPGEHVARGGQKRFSDIVWKVQRKGRSDAPCYIAILLEFQSTPDRLMALRLLTYVALLLEELAKDKEVQESGLLPPVLPIVLYNGSAPWTGTQNVAELFAPMPENLRPFNPKMSYLLLNEREVPPAGLQDGGVAAQLVRMEQAQSEAELNAAIQSVLQLLPDAGDAHQAALLAAFSLFYASTVPARFGAAVPQSFDLRKEHPMLAETVDRWREEAIAKGRAEGEARGIAKGRAEGEAKGRAEGEAKGRAEGEAKGRAEGRAALRSVARQLLRMDGFTPEAVARITGLQESEVRALAAAQ